jgi:hypothetical protein
LGYADAVCALTLLAFVYAVLVTAFARGRRQVAAGGFVVASACLVLAGKLGGDYVPIERLVAASGIGEKAVPPTPALEAADYQVKLLTTPYEQGDTTLENLVNAKRRQEDLKLQAGSAALAVYLRAANAVATLAFGLMGSLVGLMAFRASGE